MSENPNTPNMIRPMEVRMICISIWLASTVAFRHGLRAAEVVDLRWDQIDFDAAVLHVRRVKNGSPSTHPLDGEELRALRRLKREAPSSAFVFVSERGVFDGGPCQDGGATRQTGQVRNEGPSASATARLRLCASQSGARHANAASVFGSPKYSAHGSVHRACAGPVQELLARIARRRTQSAYQFTSNIEVIGTNTARCRL